MRPSSRRHYVCKDVAVMVVERAREGARLRDDEKDYFWLPAPFASSSGILIPYALCGLALISGSWGIMLYPWFTIWLPLVVAALPQLSRWITHRRSRTAQTENLVAYTEADSEKSPALLLGAHVDSAQAGPFQSYILRGLHNRRMDIIYIVVIALAALALLSSASLGFAYPLSWFWGLEYLAPQPGCGCWRLRSGGWFPRTSHIPPAQSITLRGWVWF